MKCRKFLEPVLKIYDISKEVFSAPIYPGDPIPQRETLVSMERGAVYNLTAFSMCAHNGTHIDAPRHFLKDGDTVESIPLEKTVGLADVTAHDGILTGADAERILCTAERERPEAAKRILLKGNAVVSEDAARVFASAGVILIGTELLSVGPEEAPMAVHQILLGVGTVLLESLSLCDVPEGVYHLSAAPLLLGGSDGAPCRAYLAVPEY
jgi:arylformamidase